MNKKKIIMLSDDMRIPSGVGTMSHSVISGTAHIFDWVQIGGAVKHPDNGKIFDLSKDINETLGIDNAYVKVYPVDGYGNEEILREIMDIEGPIDGIVHFTDPRFWGWLYQMEHELRQNIPLMYYNIWDDLPFPHWNEPFYDSCDLLMAISKQTYNINKNVCVNSPRVEGTDLTYVPHGIDENIFKPVDTLSADFIEFKEQIDPKNRSEFVAVFNSRNIHRKRVADLILGYTKMCDKLTEEEWSKCLLVLHTDPIDQHGTDLPALVTALCKYPVAFSTQKMNPTLMNYLYNIADVVCNPSSAEGFGLSHMEAIMSGTPTIATVVGGLQDQMGFTVSDKDGDRDINTSDFTSEIPSNSTGQISKEHGSWTYPLWPQLNLQGSPVTPYIYDSRPSIQSITNGLEYWYNMDNDNRVKAGLAGREWAIKNGFTKESMCNEFTKGINTCLENFTPRDKYSLIDTSAEAPKINRGVIL